MRRQMTTRRKYLQDYTAAHRDIELTEAAIGLLERVSGTAAVVKSLKRKQQVALRRLDTAAAKLGAPYQWGALAKIS